MEKTICKYYESCGGCSLQHLDIRDYYSYKKQRVLDIAARLGLEQSLVADIAEIGEGQRRRVDLKISVNKKAVHLGFFAQKSHEVVDIESCPIANDNINSLISALRVFLLTLKKPGTLESISITALADGFDIMLYIKADIHKSDIPRWVNFAEENNVIRLCSKKEKEEYAVIKNGSPQIRFADVEVTLPKNAFLQASPKAQDLITEYILQNIDGDKNIIDFFSGCGTYSFPLSDKAQKITAYESDGEMVASMNNAARNAGLDDRVSATNRDLFKRPLKAAEMKYIDIVVINPPRAGAKEQISEIAKSDIAKLLMVSCKAETFERDAKILLNAGFTIKQIVPIDQFYMSDHLEIFALFTR